MKGHPPAQPKYSPPLILTLDRTKKDSRGRTPTSRAERTYARSLRQIGQHVGEIISGFTPGDMAAVPSLVDMLSRYAEALTPWAERTAARMLGEVNDRDREAWRSLGNSISAGLRDLILGAPVGAQMQELLREQVTLIKSLPIEAGQRVHELTLQGLEDSTRAREIAREIRRSDEVTESRAMLIARTEVSRTASVLLEARAQYAGSTHYIWRTSRDGAVRPGHRAMEGKVCEWASPPAVDEGGRIMHHHPGQIWNCRCYPEPILAE